ncbi:MAG: hypothetical protein QW666_01605 [Candidatus Woesearchaeota archaeon]
MRCLKHHRAIVGPCQWCGKQLCQNCVAKKEGSKLYCEKCAIQLSGIKRAKVPPVKPQSVPEIPTLTKESQQPEKTRYTIDKDGYLILEQ